jgi:uncharacterized Zn finger protein
MEKDVECFCPACGEVMEHEVIARGRNPLARCLECGSVHSFEAAKEKKTFRVKAIVSAEGISRVCQVEMEEGEPCRIGDRFVALCGDEYIGVEVTAIERGGSRAKKAISNDITTLWTRKVEEVAVRISLHSGRTTTSLQIIVPGEEPFVVGEAYKAGQRRIRVSRIKIRQGTMLRREGAKAQAREIRRIFAYPL